MLHTRDWKQICAKEQTNPAETTFTMSSVLHPRRVPKAKSNATSKLAGAIVVSLVIVLLLISVALWFLGRKRTKHRSPTSYGNSRQETGHRQSVRMCRVDSALTS
jgi:flagellar biogenesis protein FliO